MVIVEIIGGLGNQMFQYAFKMAYDNKNAVHSCININTFQNYKRQSYQLNVFNIDSDLATPSMVKKTLNARRVLKWRFPFDWHHETISNIVKEKNENIYEPELLNKTGDIYFSGYFQTDKYFRRIRSDVLNAFTLKVPLNLENQKILNKIQKTKNSVSIHVRRGDYVQLQHIYGITDTEYYERAIEYISKNVKEPHFFVFSNDIEWCRKNIKTNHSITFVDINTAETGYFDLELMRNCKHNIIANSSFSWWGAWLNENPDKIVIAPQQWFFDGRSTDILPDDWIKL